MHEEEELRRRVRLRMVRARAAMTTRRWHQAATILRQVIRELVTHGLGHAEALWALAVCLDAQGEETAALAALDESLHQDATALTTHETRDAFLLRLVDMPANGRGQRRRATRAPVRRRQTRRRPSP